MDRRCLYGHRVNATFHHAIERDQCPICGAELITLDGYRLARQLAQTVPLDGGAAFRAVKLIETNYVLKPRPATTTEARPGVPPSAEAPTSGPPSPGLAAADPPPGTEITLEEEDLAHAAPRPAAPSRPLAEEREDDDSVELIAAETTDEQERATRRAPATPRAAGPRARTAAGRPAGPPKVPTAASTAPTASTAAPFTAEEDAFFATSP
ncbi:hypothetical protein L6R53_21445 [Myxococcota bacterium]|nr:hypothetical protein [Myxococcota bacterium]